MGWLLAILALRTAALVNGCRVCQPHDYLSLTRSRPANGSGPNSTRTVSSYIEPKILGGGIRVCGGIRFGQSK